jgi:hypothetical protein
MFRLPAAFGFEGMTVGYAVPPIIRRAEWRSDLWKLSRERGIGIKQLPEGPEFILCIDQRHCAGEAVIPEVLLESAEDGVIGLQVLKDAAAEKGIEFGDIDLVVGKREEWCVSMSIKRPQSNN